MSDKAMAEQFGVSDKTISRALGALEEKGLIKRETKNVKKGKERHIHITNRQNVSCEEPTDKLSIAQQTNCPLSNRQNDLIKEKDKNINIKEKQNLSDAKEMIHNLANSDGSFKM